jgi:crotonobetaine/carnitine-CoA ligase
VTERRDEGVIGASMLDRAMLAPHAVARWARVSPDAPAVMHVEGERATYRELHHDSLSWARALGAIGVGAGTHVATLLPNRLCAHRTMLGLAWLRAVEVPLNTAYIGDMLRHALTVSEATVLVTTRELLAHVRPLPADVPFLHTAVIVDAADGLPPAEPITLLAMDDLISAAASDAADFSGPEPWDVSSLLFTSGTTGASKAVISPWGLTYQMWSWVPDDTIGPGEALFSAMPLFHNSGRSGFNYVLSRGGCLVTRDKFSAAHVWDDVRQFNCVALALVGPLTALLHAAEPRPDDADNPVRSVILGPMIPQIADFERRFGVRVAIAYGQTEIGAPIVSTWDHGPWETCGRARESWPHHEVRLVDEYDEPVPTGSVGEFVVRAEPWSLMLGYYGLPDRTVEAWRNGWFHTGDAFRADQDGYYYFVDRLNDAIRRRGENISSFEVEAAVQQHPAVRECAAVGARTQFGDDEVMAVVIAEPGLEPAALHAFLVDRMPTFMQPRYIRLVDELPRNATTGRVRKNELRAEGITVTTWDARA